MPLRDTVSCAIIPVRFVAPQKRVELLDCWSEVEALWSNPRILESFEPVPKTSLLNPALINTGSRSSCGGVLHVVSM